MMQFELTPEQKQLKGTARLFAADEIIPVAAAYDEEQKFPEDVARKAWEIGLMNFAVPGEFCGPGLSALDTCLVLEELKGVPRREADAGRQAPPDLRRDEPDPAGRHSAQSPERLIRHFELTASTFRS